MRPDRTPSVVLPRFLLDGHREQIESAADGRATLIADDDPVLGEGTPTGLEVVVTGIDQETFDRLIRDGDVRWVHSVSAGVEHLPLEAMAEREILLTNSAGAYASAMAEYTVAGMIMLSRNLHSWLEGQRERRWLEADSFEASLLRGKRLGIVGYGAVGRELAVAARALGMEVWATKRSPLFLSGEPLARLLPSDAIHELLAASDFVALCASLNSSTRHLIGEPELAAMKPSAMLVNVARGGLVDEVALVHALKEGATPRSDAGRHDRGTPSSRQRSLVGPEPPDHAAHLRERPRELGMGGRVLLREPPSLPGRIARSDGEPRRLFRGLLT